MECNVYISNDVENYSLTNYGIPLCIEHQRWVDHIEQYSTEYAIKLYFNLKSRGVPAELEKFDGHKHIDIAIPQARINIEVDGQHHNYNPKQALSDLKRTYYSFKKGYYTIRIPNSLTKDLNTLTDTTDLIVEILNEANKKRYY
jgi:hypothetical protein